MKHPAPFRNRQTRWARAFTLVEVTLALGIAGISLVVLIGLLPVGLSTNKASTEQTNAAGILADICASARAVPQQAYQTVIPIYGIYLPGGGASTFYLHEDGSLAGKPNQSVDPTTNPYYRLTISTVGPLTASAPNSASTTQHMATIMHMTINWPALGERINTHPPPKYANMLEVVSTIDRN